MSNAQKFFNMAIRNNDCPDRAYGIVENLAAIAVMGSIEGECFRHTPEPSYDRDTFITLGFRYLERFDETAEQAIKDLEQIPEDVRTQEQCGVIREIRGLQKRSKCIELAQYFQLLADDWDERYGADEDEEAALINESEADITTLREQLETEHQARTIAEQAAAVATAELKCSEQRAANAEAQIKEMHVMLAEYRETKKAQALEYRKTAMAQAIELDKAHSAAAEAKIDAAHLRGRLETIEALKEAATA